MSLNVVMPYRFASEYPDGNCINGTATNITVDTSDNPSFTTGCYDFNGSSSDVEISNSLVTTACSISVWFNTNAVSGNQSIFGNSGTVGLNLYLHGTTGKVRCNQTSGGDQIIDDTSISAGTWYNVIVTKTAESGGGGNATTILYVDNATTDNATNWSDFTSGATAAISGTAGDYFNGFITDFAIWNTVIASGTRTAINAGSGALISSLSDKTGITTYYPCNALDGSTVTNIAC
tara:strand:- start:36 stop:737 length:702 start_codon:yes stop_codon:yes gene_type:complete